MGSQVKAVEKYSQKEIKYKQSYLVPLGAEIGHSWS